jgi:hypothetical protein
MVGSTSDTPEVFAVHAVPAAMLGNDTNLSLISSSNTRGLSLSIWAFVSASTLNLLAVRSNHVLISNLAAIFFNVISAVV